MNTKSLLIVSALIELGAGIALLAIPSLAAELLLGDALTAPAALVVARVAGAALLSIAVACWLGRNAAHSGLIVGLLIYNVAVPIMLAHGWYALSLNGWGLWPATILHVLLAAWCTWSLLVIRS